MLYYIQTLNVGASLSFA